MLAYYGLEEKYVLFKEWYEGYHFGNVDVYCPWDVINQCDKFCESRNAPMEPYWENSSSNFIVRDILENSSETTKSEIEALISGDTIQKMLIPELTYTDLDNKETRIRQTYLWSVLFAAGYLTDAGEAQGGVHRLGIPNKEILGIYEKKISSWFHAKVTSDTAKWKELICCPTQSDMAVTESILGYFCARRKTVYGLT